MKSLKIGFSLFLLLLTSFSATTAEALELIVDVPRMITYAEGRRNVQLFGDAGDIAKNVWIQAHVMTYPGNHAGFVFRCDAIMKNYYECIINVHRRKLDLTVYRNGSAHNIKSVSVPSLVQNRLYELWVGMYGNRIVVYLDGRWLIDHYDDTLQTAGFTGTATYHSGSTFLDLLSYSYD